MSRIGASCAAGWGVDPARLRVTRRVVVRYRSGVDAAATAAVPPESPATEIAPREPVATGGAPGDTPATGGALRDTGGTGIGAADPTAAAIASPRGNDPVAADSPAASGRRGCARVRAGNGRGRE